MRVRLLLSIFAGLVVTFLVYSSVPDIDSLSDYYAKNIRASLFTGFLTVGSFLLSLKVFIIVKFKENIFDSAAYRAKLEEKRKLNSDLTHYGPVKRLSRLLFAAILSALAASAAQLTVGLVPVWPATLFCVFIAAFSGAMLLCTLWLIRQILDEWLSYLEV